MLICIVVKSVSISSNTPAKAITRMNINQDLMLAGWDFMQRETIHSYLKNGIPLSIAVQQTSKQILQCPINSKLFFKSSSIYR